MTIVPGPSSQGGLGEEGALVGTTTPSGPSPPRGSGVPVRKSVQKSSLEPEEIDDQLNEEVLLTVDTLPMMVAS